MNPISATPAFLSAQPFVPHSTQLNKLEEASRVCEGCELYKFATQTVFGTGPKHAPLLLVGEQPGDQEDLTGQPFVGPAGKLLDKALAAAQIDRAAIYVTNAVKHFKFQQRGKKRLHSKANAREIKACKPWLVAEMLAVQPKLIVCLGATAAQSMFGSSFKITQQRGLILQAPTGEQCLATYHPSALLRALAHGGYDEMWSTLVTDLRTAAEWAKEN